MGSTVDGLVSGMDTTSMIQSMMKIESQPQVLLKNKVSTVQGAVTAYQSVNSKLSSLKTAADDLGQLSTWRSVKPTVSSSSVTATATGALTTATGSVTFDVVSLAKAQANTARVASTGDITSSDSIQVTFGQGDPVTVDISADRSAAGIAQAINSTTGLSLKASVVATSQGDSVLQLNGTKTGAANAFTISGLDDVTTMRTTTAASDAQLQVGGADEDGGYSLTSSTNAFTGLMPGVTLTVSKVETGVTLDSNPDVDGIAAKFQALVDAANNTLTEIGNQTAYDSGTNTGSPLTGDFMVRQMSQTILSQVSRGLSYTDDSVKDGAGNPTTVKFGSMNQFGIALDSSGKLTFDKAKFAAAYAADPTAIRKAGTAFADQMESLAGTQSTNVTSVITSNNNQIDSLNDQISNWDVRLAARQDALSKQYADLETALGKLKDQSTWLSGQLSSLG